MRIILLFVLFAAAQNMCAQSSVGTSYQPRMIAQSTMPPVEPKESLQTKYLQHNWSTGKVFLKTSQRWVQMPLLFDQFRNKIYFKEGDNMMELAEPASQFYISFESGGNSFTYFFKNGFPAIHRNTGDTFYEVLAEGKFQLLKCKAHTIGAYKERELDSTDPDYDKEMYYAYLPNGKMVHIKAGKESLGEALTDYRKEFNNASSQIEKVKSEKQLKEFFTLLNQ